jgi:hypothetical protein
MATRNYENPSPQQSEYGYRLNISRERAGYRPKSTEQEQEELKRGGMHSIVTGLIQWLAPKGNPDSYQRQ